MVLVLVFAFPVSQASGEDYDGPLDEVPSIDALLNLVPTQNAQNIIGDLISKKPETKGLKVADERLKEAAARFDDRKAAAGLNEALSRGRADGVGAENAVKNAFEPAPRYQYEKSMSELGSRSASPYLYEMGAERLKDAYNTDRVYSKALLEPYALMKAQITLEPGRLYDYKTDYLSGFKTDLYNRDSYRLDSVAAVGTYSNTYSKFDYSSKFAYSNVYQKYAEPVKTMIAK